MVLDPPACPFDILIDLFGSPDTRFIDTHPRWDQVAIGDLVVSENHSAEFT